MKNLFHINLSYLTNKTSIEIELSSRFKALMAEATAICLAFAHTGGAASDSSGGLAILEKLAFAPASKSKYTPKEMQQALDLVCRAALHYSDQGRPYDNLARVIVMLAQAYPCRFPKMRLPKRKKLPGRPHFSEMGTAAYELLRQSDGRRAPEVPIFVAYHSRPSRRDYSKEC
jgi:hypothetical protein